MSETADILSEALDVAEETMDVLESTRYISVGTVVAVALVAGGIGAAASFYITRKRLQTKYDIILEAQIESTKSYYARQQKKDDFETPEKAARVLHPAFKGNNDEAIQEASDAVRSYQGEAEDEGDEDWEEGEEVTEEAEEEGSLNVFLQAEPDENWDIEEEMLSRTPQNPYVISKDEFFHNEVQNSQTTLTFYEGDGVLADEREQDVPYIDPIIGEENLSRFGHGSGDNRVMYIRNERLSADYEVLRHDGKYAYEVLGLQHSDGGARGRQQRNEPRKYRGGDE